MVDKFKKQFGNQVKVLRRVKGLTQENLAEIMNISVISIANIENGRSAIGFSKLPNLAKALDVDIYKLFANLEIFESSNLKGNIVTLLDTATNKQLHIIQNIIQEILKL